MSTLTVVTSEILYTSEVPLTSSGAPATTEVPSTTEVPLTAEPQVSYTEIPASSTEPATTQILAEPKISIQEVFTQPPATEIPITLPATQESETSAPATVVSVPEPSVLPTEFEKLLTTLREFVAKVDASTSTEAPKLPEIPKLDQIVEYVNYTVSAETEKITDEAKPISISKRSVPEADLIPRYYKQHYSSNKEKGCIFNGRNFKLGEEIKTDNDCLKCQCEFAPIGHCILKEKCNF